MTRIAAAAILLWASGCAASLGPSIAHDEREMFRSPQFDRARLKAGGLALLGVTSKVAPEGIRDDVAFVIDQVAANEVSKVRVLTRADTLATARQAGMSADLQRLMAGYEDRGAIEAGLLRRMAALLGVRYVWMTGILQYERITRDIAPPPSAVTPGLRPRGQGTERVQRVRLRAEIWDSRCGVLVWAAEGGTEAVEETMTEDVRLNDVLSMAAANLISVLPKSGEGGTTAEKECGV